MLVIERDDPWSHSTPNDICLRQFEVGVSGLGVEQEGLLYALVNEWFDRVEEHTTD
jgi:hypothetical protein